MAQRNRELNVVVKEWDDLSTQKVKLEEEVLLKLQDQIINDKASAYMKKLVMKNRQKNMDTVTFNNNNNAPSSLYAYANLCLFCLGNSIGKYRKSKCESVEYDRESETSQFGTN